MKISKITLFNVGPYSGENIFEIDCSNKEKNIILIGGKNGAGKTTFFTSLRTCIYGYKAYGYESNNQYYFDSIYDLINDNEKFKEIGYAKVELELLFDDGMDNNIYTITREWIIKNKKVKENYKIVLNDCELVGDELNDFENYLLHVIPPNLFKFYFFDGEKIGEFFLQSNQDNSFKNAFLTMTGFDNIELLLKNFRRNISLKSSNSKANQYFSTQNELDQLKNDLINQNNQLQKLISISVEYSDQIAKLDKEYSNSGGLLIDEWQEINKKILLEESLRESLHKQRKELANSEIPYLILKEKLVGLKQQIKIEDDLNKNKILDVYINRNNLEKLFSGFTGSDKFINTLCDYVDSFKPKDMFSNSFLYLSEQEKGEILSQIDRHSNFNKNDILSLTKQIKNSLLRTQKLKKFLEKSSIDKYQEFMDSKMELINNKTKIDEKIKLCEIDIFQLQSFIDSKEIEFKKIKKEYEDELKVLSVNDISSRALLALSDVSEELLMDQIYKVEGNFKKVFKKLINKDDFIDGIFIDEKLNIYPYKNIKVEKNKIKHFLNDDNNLSYVEKRASGIIAKSINDENNYIDIPQEIKSPFSQGEKQVYIMSIYFALMQISRVEVPFVIDTPFARIDKEHRKNIINNFFMKLVGQVFILSTDEEINSEHMAKIKNHISNEYLLIYESRGKTTVLKNEYFGGGKK